MYMALHIAGAAMYETLPPIKTLKKQAEFRPVVPLFGNGLTSSLRRFGTHARLLSAGNTSNSVGI